MVYTAQGFVWVSRCLLARSWSGHLETFENEAFAHEDERTSPKRVGSTNLVVLKLKEQLDQLGSYGAHFVVHNGYVDDPRATDNAWIETIAIHMHCPYELGAQLKLAPGDGIKDAAWVDVDYLRKAHLPLYASHVEWLDRVEQRMQQRTASLASILVRWGRHDVAERVLRDPELLEQRSLMFMQPSFQQAMQRATSERNFNVELLDLLIDHGCTPAAVSLSQVLEMASEDPYLLLSDMKRKRDFLYSRRKQEIADRSAAKALKDENKKERHPKQEEALGRWSARPFSARKL